MVFDLKVTADPQNCRNHIADSVKKDDEKGLGRVYPILLYPDI